jgi:hypothetical protein
LEEREELLILLRKKNLRISNLTEQTKQRLKILLEKLHRDEMLSLNDISSLIGNKTSGYVSWLMKQLGIKAIGFEESRLRSIRRKRRKYERKAFCGSDKEKAYLLGLTHGDLSVTQPWKNVIKVTTSTTHPAMAELFCELFGGYGHVSCFPRFKKDTGTYEWNLSVYLDVSFSFLTWTKREAWRFLRGKCVLMNSYLAGVIDSEGSIIITKNGNNTALMLSVFNTDTSLLKFLRCIIIRNGCSPLKIRLNKRAGLGGSKFKIPRRKDYWCLTLSRFEQVQSLLKTLPVRHPEKMEKKDLALKIKKGTPWREVSNEVEEIRSRIKQDVELFCREAKEKYLKRHRCAYSH